MIVEKRGIENPHVLPIGFCSNSEVTPMIAEKRGVLKTHTLCKSALAKKLKGALMIVKNCGVPKTHTFC